MKNLTLENIAKAVKGTLYNAPLDSTAEVCGVVLDSRKVEQNYLFIATRGERVDGHSFINDVFAKGAMAVICEKEPQLNEENSQKPYIIVHDSFQALKDVATFYRKQLSVKVVGITGSVGKTSTKEVIASVLSAKYKVLKTEGNFNNEVGLPLTVLRIRDDIEIAVLEMGISDFCEMHRLSCIAKPDVCVITNIGQCHLENLGTRDGILKAKTEIFDYMQPDASICLNGDDDKLITVGAVKGRKPIFFGCSESFAIHTTQYENKGLAGISLQISRPGEVFEAEVPLPGEHMVNNALAAVAVGTVFGLTKEEIIEGLAKVEAVGGRSHIIQTDKLTIVDDCYNANPVSMKAAIDLLNMANTRKVAILGDMFELGMKENEFHAEIGRYAAAKNIDCIICVGKLSRNMYEGAEGVGESFSKVIYCETKQDMLASLSSILEEKDTVLVKASHGMHFEEIVKALQDM
ncbi:MAG: UDP-N-acetylmuramoyl-tripeptide--D-alanyl-D-alanine ligase [Lachnospiraceae bacterium]|nr:UDP-N-acetylmuramoyl-tripeptide--D-alanyl-D-alanine ligase [Lachnospiraceae bacterium]